MDDVCRACRKTGQEYQLHSMMISNLMDMYSFCTDIPVSADNEKCYKICEHCMGLLISFNDFKKLCIESDNYFKRSTLVEIKIESSEDPLEALKEQTLKDDDRSVKDDFYDGDNFNDSNCENAVPDENPTASEPPHQCEVCLKKFAKMTSLKIHQSKKCKINKEKGNQSKKIVCPICSRKFLKKEVYEFHMVMHKGGKPYECLDCDKKFMTPASLREHTETTHLKTTKYSCHICQKYYFTKRKLRSHVRGHTNVLLECDKCHKKFHLRASLITHIKGYCNMKCDTCHQVFLDRSEFRTHILTHIQENTFKCKICETDFIYFNSFKHHVKMEHPEKQNEDCIDDPKRLISVNNDAREPLPGGLAPVKRKSVYEKKYICNICGKRLITAISLNNHLMIHTGEQPHECDQCDYKCRYKGQLSSHSKSFHEKKPNVKCPVCPYRTYISSALNRHMKTHNDEKPFVCEVCDAAFKSSDFLKIHMRSHTGEKPYQCTFCSKDFASASYLKQHTYIHTGEKRFTCKICDKKFNQRTPLVKHMESHKNGSKSLKPKSGAKDTKMKDDIFDECSC